MHSRAPRSAPAPRTEIRRVPTGADTLRQSTDLRKRAKVRSYGTRARGRAGKHRDHGCEEYAPAAASSCDVAIAAVATRSGCQRRSAAACFFTFFLLPNGIAGENASAPAIREAIARQVRARSWTWAELLHRVRVAGMGKSWEARTAIRVAPASRILSWTTTGGLLRIASGACGTQCATLVRAVGTYRDASAWLGIQDAREIMAARCASLPTG